MTTTTTRIWGNYVLETRVEFGSAARRNRGRWDGKKTHRLFSEYVVDVIDEAKENAVAYQTVGKTFLRTQKPQLFSCQPCCGCTQGQNAGRPVCGKAETDVNCEKCKSR